MSFDDILKKIKKTPNKSFYAQKAIDSKIFGWKDIEAIINNPSMAVIGLIENNNEKHFSQRCTVMHSRFLYDKIKEGNTFFIADISRWNKEINEICKKIEKSTGLVSQIHAYAGYNSKCKSFTIHCDPPHNLIMQVDGVSLWTVYKENGDQPGPPTLNKKLTIDFQVNLNPGDLIYVPSGRYHYNQPNAKRISLSMPFTNTYNNPPDNLQREWFKF